MQNTFSASPIYPIIMLKILNTDEEIITTALYMKYFDLIDNEDTLVIEWYTLQNQEHSIIILVKRL